MSKGQMLVYFDESRDPAGNLAREEELFQRVERRELPELARFWIDTECLVRGRARSPRYGWYRERLAARMKVPVLMRATGGGVVYHDQGNLNWSFFLRNDGAIASPTKLFDRGSRNIVDALHRLGVDAKFAPPNRIDVGDRKVSGMAARSTSHAVLVHGTLLLRADLKKLDRLCIPPPGCPPVANLEEWIPEVQPLQVVRAVVEALKDAGFGVNVAQGAELRRSLGMMN